MCLRVRQLDWISKPTGGSRPSPDRADGAETNQFTWMRSPGTDDLGLDVVAELSAADDPAGGLPAALARFSLERCPLGLAHDRPLHNVPAELVVRLTGRSTGGVAGVEATLQ